MRQVLVALLIIAAAALAGYLLVSHNSSSPTVTIASSTSAYISTTYGFAFRYPTGSELREDSAQEFDIGTTTSGIFDSLTHIKVALATTSRGLSFADFVHTEASSLCPQQFVSARCIGVSRTDAFSAASGVEGDVFYLEYVGKDPATQASTTREAGPFYAFNISANVPRAPFAALLVFPTHFAEESLDYDTGAALSNLLVNTLRLNKK